MDAKKLIKTAIKVVPFVTATAGVLSLALSKYQEKQGDYSREFVDVENELKAKIDEVRMGYGKEN
jgi:hypothetical protein